jgi:TPP-dependent indolepyruvate ferredoxin oxidoreductase alpha subunit
MTRLVSGAYALACGAIEASVSLVTGYPGAPARAVVNAVLQLTSPNEGKRSGGRSETGFSRKNPVSWPPRERLPTKYRSSGRATKMVRLVDLDRGEDIRTAIEMGMNFDGVAVVIARGRCVRWSAAG